MTKLQVGRPMEAQTLTMSEIAAVAKRPSGVSDKSKSQARSPRRGVFVFPVAYLFGIMTAFGLGMGWQAYMVLKQYHKPRNYFSMEAAHQLIDCYVWALLAIGIWQLMR